MKRRPKQRRWKLIYKGEPCNRVSNVERTSSTIKFVVQDELTGPKMIPYDHWKKLETSTDDFALESSEPNAPILDLSIYTVTKQFDFQRTFLLMRKQ